MYSIVLIGLGLLLGICATIVSIRHLGDSDLRVYYPKKYRSKTLYLAGVLIFSIVLFRVGWEQKPDLYPYVELIKLLFNNIHTNNIKRLMGGVYLNYYAWTVGVGLLVVMLTGVGFYRLENKSSTQSLNRKQKNLVVLLVVGLAILGFGVGMLK